MWFLSFQRRTQTTDAWKFSTFNSLANVSAFSWIMAVVNGTFWLRIVRNQSKIALSTISKLPVLNFCRLMLLPFRSQSKTFSLFLTQVDKVFFRTQHLTATSLLLIPISKSWRAWHFSRKVLWFYLRLPATNMFKCEQQTKNKQMIVYSNIRIHNINKIEH